MSFKLTVNGVTIECETAAEAIELAQLAPNKTSPNNDRRHLGLRPGPGRPPKNGRAAKQKDSIKVVISSALQFLRVIEEKGKGGASSDDMVLALGLKESRAIGGRIIRVKSVLFKRGFTQKRVFRTIKTSEGKVWRSGPDMKMAIEQLEKTQEGGGL